MTEPHSPHASQNMPRMGNAFTRWIGRMILKSIGWKIVGQLPNEKKIIIIGAPHTSNWDFIIAMGSMLSVGLRFSWMMKKEAFFWPLGGLWKVMGGVPIDRKSKNDTAQQMADWFNSRESGWIGITPEGTRSKVEGLKKGYLRIAYAAQVPIFIIGLSGPTKEVILDKVWPLKYDTEKDNRAVKNYFAKSFIGIRPENGL